MNDYKVTDECNPGGGTYCPCSINDAGIEYFNDYTEIISNKNQNHLWINSIGYHKFIDSLPNGKPIAVSQYKYSFQTKMTTLPKPDTAQIQNSQAVHLMIQLYNGSGLLWSSAKEAREGALYWELNPWNTDFGKIKVYSTNFQLMETGIILNPDTNWHTFGLEIDFNSIKYKKIYIDTIQTDISNIQLLVKPYPDWGTENVLGFTAESMATWPGDSCNNIFTWKQQFKDAKFYFVSSSTGMENPHFTGTDLKFKLTRDNNYISIISKDNSQPERIKLFDITGRLIIQKEFSDNYIKVPINQLKAGLYFVEILNHSITTLNKIVIFHSLP